MGNTPPLNRVYWQSSQRCLDIFLSLVWLCALLPAMLCNVLLALVTRKSLFAMTQHEDALGRSVVLRRFNVGYVKSSAVCIDVLFGHVSLCGVPLQRDQSVNEWLHSQQCLELKPGLISLVDLHKQTGASFTSTLSLVEQQLRMNVSGRLGLVVKYLFCRTFFSQPLATLEDTIELFGLPIFNQSMHTAVDLIMSPRQTAEKANTYCFVNAHSINQMARSQGLVEALRSANTLFADGSGMRLAAQKAQKCLRDNINGTDMLPLICAQAVRLQKRIFLLGAKPGVAAKAAENLVLQFPQLEIAGVQHGYFERSKTQNIIDQINLSNADIVLVAFGSPVQEGWIAKYAHSLSCDALIAVGGLFDFYSGEIARAPIAMRQLGLEWVWRLIQEPKTKFTRYVLGTPEFLIRIFFTQQVSKGV